jgi:hypothetical protein
MGFALLHHRMSPKFICAMSMNQVALVGKKYDLRVWSAARALSGIDRTSHDRATNVTQSSKPSPSMRNA